MIEILLFLFVKHFIVDFLAQTPYQYLNKGKYGHPGGILHSGLHGIATYIILVAYAIPLALTFALFDFLVHYHIDWGKVNINNHYGWTATNSEKFWWLLGLDQFLHYMTYLIIVSLL